MVASRYRALSGNGVGNGYNKYDHTDLESGNGENFTSRPRQRFRDAIETTMNQEHARNLKKQLLENVDHKGLEKFRKSDDEAGSYPGCLVLASPLLTGCS
jgi:hypothetical protein